MVNEGYHGNTPSKFKATGWEVTGGLDRFEKIPLICFANHQTLKLDNVSSAQLMRAADKFGLSKEQLHVTNDWIAHNNNKYTGLYDKKQDRVHLSSNSLSLLVHECVHRLKEKQLIPKKEFRAMVSAGKRLVAADKNLFARIEKGKNNDNKLYKENINKDEEYAAIWAENFYERENTARKYLMNEKVPVFSKIIYYIKEAKIILKSYINNDDERIARAFLRKIEQNQPQKTKKLKTMNQNLLLCK